MSPISLSAATKRVILAAAVALSVATAALGGGAANTAQAASTGRGYWATQYAWGHYAFTWGQIAVAQSACANERPYGGFIQTKNIWYYFGLVSYVYCYKWVWKSM
jgi:hypothetical protein